MMRHPDQEEQQAEETTKLKETEVERAVTSRFRFARRRCFLITLFCILSFVTLVISLAPSPKQDSTDDIGESIPKDADQMEVESGEQVREGLSRHLLRGYPLVENYPTPFWRLTKAELQRLYGAIGYPKGNAVCAEPSTSTSQVLTVIQQRGFGSNMLGLTDDISWAAQTRKKRFVLISRRNQLVNQKETGTAKVKFSLAYERMFSFAVENDTLCTNWNEICEGSIARKELCKGPSHLRISFAAMTRLKEDNPRLFFGHRVELMRLITRIREPTKVLLDKAIAPFKALVGPELNTIAIHVRRTDKHIEAAPTPVIDYVKAALRVVRSHAKGQKVDAIFVITDDPKVGQNVISSYNDSALDVEKPQMGYILRDSSAGPRPDSVNDDEMEESSIVEVLLDLKLMVLARYFVGTRSSNFGLMACYLRGGMACFNAESRTEPYTWVHAGDKLT